MNDVMDQIIENLAFEIEAVPNETKGEMSTSLYDPLNLKIRVRNKDKNKILRQGIISIPKRDDPNHSNDKIQLSNSDQTIMSFNVLMDQDESTNNQRKHKRKFRFFKRGSCLGNQTEDDPNFPNRGNRDNVQLVPIKSSSINEMNKRNFTLTKMYGNSETKRMEKGTHKDILGKCKPGGCLDPPYGEDKYSYVPKVIKMSRIEKNSSKRKSNDVEYQKPINKKANKKEKDEISYVSEKKEQLSLHTNINLSNTKHSNSIITYPSTSSNESINKDIKKSVPYNNNNNNSKLSNISSEIVETYFISPKKIKIQNDKLQELSITDIGAEKHSFVKPLSKGQKLLDKLDQEILKKCEDAKPEDDIVDPYITIQCSNNNFENIDTHLPSQTSVVDLSRKNYSVLNQPQNEVYTNSSLTSLNNTILEAPDTDSLKVSIKPIPMFSASPIKKKSVEKIEENEEKPNKKSSLETFKQDQSFISKKMNNGIEMTEHENEEDDKENRNALELELQNEELTLINELSTNKSLGSNQNFNTKNDSINEITNLNTDSIIPDSSIFFKHSSSKISIVGNDLTVNENIITSNQDLIIPSTKMNQNLDSNFSNVDIHESNILTEKNTDPYLEQKYEKTLLNTTLDSNVLSNDYINEASKHEIEPKNASLTEFIEIQNSVFDKHFIETPIENIADEGHNDFTALTDLKQSNDQVLLTNDNDIQISEKVDTDKTTIKSVKSNIDNSSLFIDIQDTEFDKVHPSLTGTTLATRSLTSMEKKLNEYNTLQNRLISEPKGFDSTSAPDTGIVESENIDITANSTYETLEKSSVVDNNVVPENNFIEKSKSGSNISLSINEHVKTPSPEEIQVITDKNEVYTALSTDEPTKSKSDNLINIISSANEVNLQTPLEPFIKLDEDSVKNDVNFSIAKSSTEAELEVSREELRPNDVETSNNDQSSDFHKTSNSMVDNDTNKTDERDFIRPLLKDSKLKDTVYLNMAFQSFYSEKDGNVIRTIETTNKDVQRYEDDNILQFMTLARLDDVSISIPIDREKKLLLQITKATIKEDQNAEIIKKESVSFKQDPKHKLVAFDKDNDDTYANSDSDKKKIKDTIKNSTKSDGSIQAALDNVYNQKLMPLHNIIKDLKRDVDGLLQQQLLIKDKLKNDKRIQLQTVSKNYKTCICIEQLFIEH